jgi:hypothetical protein
MSPVDVKDNLARNTKYLRGKAKLAGENQEKIGKKP